MRLSLFRCHTAARDRSAPKKDAAESSASSRGCRPRSCAPRERSGWSSQLGASARACVLGPGCVQAPVVNASPRVPEVGLPVERSAAERGHLLRMRVEANTPPGFGLSRHHLQPRRGWSSVLRLRRSPTSPSSSAANGKLTAHRAHLHLRRRNRGDCLPPPARPQGRRDG